jgi:hypothetical protein
LKSSMEKQPDLFEGSFEDIKFSSLQAAIQRQGTPEGREKIKGRPDLEIDDPFKGAYQYIISFTDKKANQSEKRVFLYMKDEDEINKFKNTLLTNSDIGMKMRKKAETVRVREELINVWKVKQSEEIFKLMEKIAFQPVKVVDNTDKKKKMRSLLTRLGIKRSMLEEKRLLEIEQSSELDQRKRRKIKGIGDLVKFCDEQRRQKVKSAYIRLIRLQPPPVPTGIIFTPRKLYLLDAEEENPNDLNTLNIDDVYICVTEQKITNREIPASGLPNSRKIQTVRIPSNSKIFATEYSTLTSPWEMDCTKFQGQYLCAYTKNLEENKIKSAGCVLINDKLPLVFTVDLTDEETRTKNNPPVISSKLAIRREKLDVPLPGQYLFKDLCKPKNFGYMRKFNTGWKKDLGLGDISQVIGVGEKYTKIRTFLGSEYTANDAIANQESVAFRWVEWNYFESIIEGLNKKVVDSFNSQNPNLDKEVIPIVDSNSFQVQLKKFTNEVVPDVDQAKKSFLFFDRDKWVHNIAYGAANLQYEKAMISGMPTYLYLPVWKSLGKTPLLKFLISKLVMATTQNNTGGRQRINVYDTLKVNGEKELNNSPSVLHDFERVVKQGNFSEEYALNLRGMLQAYLQLSILMEDASRNDVQGLLIQGFSLKNVAGLLSIMKSLLDLYYITVQNAAKDPRCAQVTKDDPFWVMLGIAFIFLPEHFLTPLITYIPTDESAQFYINMKAFGLRIAQYVKNKMFINVGSNGSFKLSAILAICIKKDAPEVYNKMTDLGFPFLSFCLETSDSLFTGALNPDTLYKLWNFIFFEGANSVKRRAQQIILSAILARVHFCKKLIMESKSASEIIWHLKADGFFNFDSSDFISEVFKVRKIHFVSEETGLVSQFKNMFGNTDSVERSYKMIKSEIKTSLEPIALSNYTYLNWVNQTIAKIEGPSGSLNISHLKEFLEKWDTEPDEKDKKYWLSIYDPKSGEGIAVAPRPGPNSITFGICYSHYGNFLPELTTIEFSVNYSNERKLLKFTDVRIIITIA